MEGVRKLEGTKNKRYEKGIRYLTKDEDFANL